MPDRNPEQLQNPGSQFIAPIYTRNILGVFPSRVQTQGNEPTAISVETETIATTGNTDGYILAPFDGYLISAHFSGTDALAANDTNYITFTITNNEASGTTAMLAATDANTTKATGGSALAADTKRALTLNATQSNLAVTAGDRIRIRTAATGTLANTVTNPVYILRFMKNSPHEISVVGNSDAYVIAPTDGNLISVDFSALSNLSTSDTNYITFSITNIGQDGTGSAAMLAATDANTTKATGGSALTGNTKRQLTLNATHNNTQVVEGDRLRIRAAVTGVLANAVAFPTFMLRFE